MAVIDFDVHHGNGTQAFLEKDPDIIFAAIHQGNFSPNPGPRGVSDLDNVINIPAARRYSGDDFLGRLRYRIFPPMRAPGRTLYLFPPVSMRTGPIRSVFWPWVPKNLTALRGRSWASPGSNLMAA